MTDAAELKEAWNYLNSNAKLSRHFFEDQYIRFGIRGVRQLIDIVKQDIIRRENEREALTL
jgi:hypothetical protein